MPAFLDRSGLLACFFLLSACAAKPVTAPAAPPAPREPDVVQQVVDYQGWLVQQTPESLAAEIERLEKTATPRAQLEHALLLAQRHQPADLEEALAVLANLQASTDPAAATWRQVATALAPAWRADLQEQKRLREQLDKQSQQMRDTQRRADQLNEKVEQLGQKLDALKSIELNLPKPASTPPAPNLPNPAATPQPRNPAS